MPNINELKIKFANFKMSLNRNGKKAEIRRIKNYLKYKKTVPNPYEEWQILNEDSNFEAQKQYKSSLNSKYTIVVPNDEAKAKIEKQSYENYEVKVWNVKEYLNNYKKLDSNYTVFVGENIKVLPFALYEIERFLEYHNCSLVYSDNDFVQDGKRVNPDFKPHFGIDTILSKNYFGNFIVVDNVFLRYNEDVLENLNEKETIYNIILRVASKTNKILHIDKVLYSKEKDDINEEEQIKIIEEYLKNKNLKYSSVEKGSFRGQYKIN